MDGDGGRGQVTGHITQLVQSSARLCLQARILPATCIPEGP